MKKFLGLFLMLCVSHVFAVTVADAGSDQTVCLSGIIQLQGNASSQGEGSYWIDKDGVLGKPGSKINGESLLGSPLNTGEYDLIYTITNGVDSTSDNLHLTIGDVPDMSNATVLINDGCEGDDVIVDVIGVVGVEAYEWKMVSGGTISFSTSAEAMVELAVDGSISARVEVVAANSCGNSIAVQGSNVINIKPRQVPVIDGESVVCASKTYTYDQLMPTTDATGWQWVWDGTYKGSGTTLSLFPSDLTNSSGLISLTPINICGAGDAAEFNIIIQQPTAPQVKLGFVGTTADGKACEDEEDLVVEVDGLFSNGGNNALYEYFVGTQSHGAASMNTDFRILQGNWKNGDQITVQMNPDVVGGCFVGQGSSVTSAPITVEGFHIPRPTLTASSNVICESEGSITLSTSTNKLNGEVIKHWTKSNIIIPDQTGEKLVVSGVNSSGDYSVTVTNQECKSYGSSINSESIKVFEQPKIMPLEFLTTENTLVFEFNEYETPIYMDENIIISGGYDETTYTWLNSSDKLDITYERFEGVSFIANKGVNDTVTFIVSNGFGEATCLDSVSFFVKDAEAVGLHDIQFVSNAFYPNPVVQGQKVFLNSKFKGAAIKIHSIEGQLELQESSVTEVNVETLESGMYLIQVENEGQLYTSKLIIE